MIIPYIWSREKWPSIVPIFDFPGMVTLTLDCGFNATAQSFNQSLSSPLYPELYPNNADCTWHIVAPRGWQIVMVFDNIKTEDCCDRLKVS